MHVSLICFFRREGNNFPNYVLQAYFCCEKDAQGKKGNLWPDAALSKLFLWKIVAIHSAVVSLWNFVWFHFIFIFFIFPSMVDYFFNSFCGKLVTVIFTDVSFIFDILSPTIFKEVCKFVAIFLKNFSIPKCFL